MSFDIAGAMGLNVVIITPVSPFEMLDDMIKLSSISQVYAGVSTGKWHGYGDKPHQRYVKAVLINQASIQ